MDALLQQVVRLESQLRTEGAVVMMFSPSVDEMRGPGGTIRVPGLGPGDNGRIVLLRDLLLTKLRVRKLELENPYDEAAGLGIDTVPELYMGIEKYEGKDVIVLCLAEER